MEQNHSSPNGAAGPVLELRNVDKYFGAVQALNGVSFQLLPTEVVAIVGDNGAGKSTMIKIISGLYQPDSGEVIVHSQVTKLSDPMHARRMGIETVYQDLALVDSRDIVSNVFLGRELTRPGFKIMLDKKGMAVRTREIVSLLKVSLPPLHTPVGVLSGGQRQAVAICRALGWGSKIVLMDEPTAALGVKESGQVLDLIRRMRDVGTSVVLIGHNLEHVFSVADRLVVMRGGRVVGTRLRADTSREDIVGLVTGAA